MPGQTKPEEQEMLKSFTTPMTTTSARKNTGFFPDNAPLGSTNTPTKPERKMTEQIEQKEEKRKGGMLNITKEPEPEKVTGGDDNANKVVRKET